MTHLTPESIARDFWLHGFHHCIEEIRAYGDQRAAEAVEADRQNWHIRADPDGGFRIDRAPANPVSEHPQQDSAEHESWCELSYPTADSVCICGAIPRGTGGQTGSDASRVTPNPSAAAQPQTRMEQGITGESKHDSAHQLAPSAADIERVAMAAYARFQQQRPLNVEWSALDGRQQNQWLGIAEDSIAAMSTPPTLTKLEEVARAIALANGHDWSPIGDATGPDYRSIARAAIEALKAKIDVLPAQSDRALLEKAWAAFNEYGGDCPDCIGEGVNAYLTSILEAP